MHCQVTPIQSIVLGVLLLVAFAVSLWPVYATVIVTNVKNAFVNGYIVAYFDRATWITGCF